MKRTPNRSLDEAILQGITSGIIVTDRRAIIIKINRALEKNFHIRQPEVIGKPFWNLFPSWEGENLRDVIMKVLKTGEAYQNERINFSHTNTAEQIVFSATINPIFKSERKILGTVTVLENLTDTVRLEEHLLKVNEELQKANRVKTDFLSMVSHEMRTPLTLIKMYTTMMADKKLGDLTSKQEKALEVMNRRCKNLNDMISDLLDISRIEAGAIDMEFEPLDLSKNITLAAASLGYRVLEKDITLFIDIEPDIPPLWADRDKFHRILTNLLENALKFTDNGGAIRIQAKHWRTTTDEYEDCAIISVSDTGIGIPRSEFNKIFQKFYQVDGSDTRKHGGTGLGLSIAKEIVELHKGRIWVESELGKGSAFHFILPFADKGEAAPKLRSVPPIAAELISEEEFILPQLTPEKTTILLVDDDEDFLSMMSEALGAEFSLHPAVNGIEALDKLCSGIKPDVIILDITMPKISGYDLCLILKELGTTKHIPVIMLTASGQEWNIQKGYEAGASGYLVKPFNMDELKEQIAKLITKKEKVLNADARG